MLTQGHGLTEVNILDLKDSLEVKSLLKVCQRTNCKGMFPNTIEFKGRKTVEGTRWRYNVFTQAKVTSSQNIA